MTNEDGLNTYRVEVGFLSPPRDTEPVVIGEYKARKGEHALAQAKERIAELGVHGTPQAHLVT